VPITVAAAPMPDTHASDAVLASGSIISHIIGSNKVIGTNCAALIPQEATAVTVEMTAICNQQFLVLTITYQQRKTILLVLLVMIYRLLHY
jgi:hypothetical protein